MSQTVLCHCGDCIHVTERRDGRLWMRCTGCRKPTLIRDERSCALEPKAFLVEEPPRSNPLLGVGVCLFVFLGTVYFGRLVYLWAQA